MSPAETPAHPVPDALATAKTEARRQARAARCALSADSCAGAARAAAASLLALPEAAGTPVVLAYGATPEELDPALALAALRERGCEIAYPRIEAPGVLGVHVVGDERDLVDGPFGLRQPAPDAPRVDRTAIDVVIVPGVAFDLDGRRLGYGGGYYDRLLPQLRPDCVRIGYAFDEQVVELIPAEDHDERVDIVVTPTRVVRPLDL